MQNLDSILACDVALGRCSLLIGVPVFPSLVGFCVDALLIRPETNICDDVRARMKKLEGTGSCNMPSSTSMFNVQMSITHHAKLEAAME